MNPLNLFLKKHFFFLFLVSLFLFFDFSFSRAQNIDIPTDGSRTTIDITAPESETTEKPYTCNSGVVPCGRNCDNKDTPEDERIPCTLCHLLIGINNVLKFGLKLAVTAAFVAIFFAGTLYVISAGDEGMMGTAKKMLTAALIGFTLVLAAWLTVNVILWIVSARDAMGVKKGANWWTFTCDTTSTAKLIDLTGGGVTPTTPGTPTTPTTPEQPTPTGYTYDPGIESQKTDASNALNALLNCMQSKLPDGAKKISSISDSAGLARCKNNYSQPPCAHTKSSCHYGGSCEAKSYGVDFGNEAYATQITAAAKACNPSAKTLNEGNHIHVSVGASNGCNCDVKL